MKHNSEINKFIQENSSLFWWIKPEEKMNISINALVEAVLNYGNEKSVKKIFDLVGIKTPDKTKGSIKCTGSHIPFSCFC